MLPGGVEWELCGSQADQTKGTNREYVVRVKLRGDERVVSGRTAKREARDVRTMTAGRMRSASRRFAKLSGQRQCRFSTKLTSCSGS